MPANRRFRIPSGVTLQECSVVIIGSTCKICGKDFKCESDVILHKRWRHNKAMGSFIDSINNDIGPKCDICGAHFVHNADLKLHKRQIHKFRRKRKLRKETVHVIFKLQGVTIVDVYLDRKYLKMQENITYSSIDADTQTPNWFDKHPDDCAGNIDLFVPDSVVNDSHMEYSMWPYRGNRYILSEFASTKDDTIECSTDIVGRSLAEILNMPQNRNTIIGSDPYKEYENPHDSISAEHTSVLLENHIHNKENSQRIEVEKKRAHCLDDSKELPVCQLIKSDPIRQLNKVAVYSVELANSVIDSAEFANAVKKHGPSSRDKKSESPKTNSKVDDDVQEVLRITRGIVAQNDINHESPNRTEREMLVKNSAELYMLSTQDKSTMYPEKCNAEIAMNVESSNFLPFTKISESSYQFLANAFDKKLGIYLKNQLRRYARENSNSNSKINNNLEKYAAYNRQNYFNPWMQAAKLQYTNKLKANDNEAIVILD